MPDGPPRAHGARRGQGVDQAGDCRVGGHRPEHGGLGPQPRDIGQAVPAQGRGKREVQQNLAGIMDHTRLTPRRRRRRYRRIQPRLAGGLDQQHGAGLRDHLATTALDADTRVRPATLTHLESSSGRSGNRDLDNPHSRWSGALSALWPPVVDMMLGERVQRCLRHMRSDADRCDASPSRIGTATERIPAGSSSSATAHPRPQFGVELIGAEPPEGDAGPAGLGKDVAIRWCVRKPPIGPHRHAARTVLLDPVNPAAKGSEAGPARLILPGGHHERDAQPQLAP